MQCDQFLYILCDKLFTLFQSVTVVIRRIVFPIFTICLVLSSLRVKSNDWLYLRENIRTPPDVLAISDTLPTATASHWSGRQRGGAAASHIPHGMSMNTANIQQKMSSLFIVQLAFLSLYTTQAVNITSSDNSRATNRI